MTPANPERPAAPVVVRPRTVGAQGAPEPLPPAEPWLSPPLESFADAGWNPPTAPVPAIDVGSVLTDPDIFSLEPEELAVVVEADDPFDALEALEAVDARDAAEPVEVPDPSPFGPITDDPVHEAAERKAASGKGLLKANLVVASGTAVSRLTGLVRTSLILVVLGKGLNDAYIGANNTPNMIYELILGGILTAALVPLFTDDMERGDGQDGTSAIISFALVALLVVSLLALIAGPALMHIFAIGAPEGRKDDYISVGVPLSLLFAPQVFFYGLMAVWSAVLNSRHRFLAAAWAPVLNNIIAITTLVLAGSLIADTHSSSNTLPDALADRRIIWILGIGTTLGIATMALALYPAIRRSGVRLHFKLRMHHPAVRRAIRLSGWTFGYVIANLIAVVIISILAEPSTGDPARYTTAYQFFQLPHALLAVSIMVTFEPLLGRADSRGDRREFNDQLLLGFRLIGLLIIPAAVGYVALPKGLDAADLTATGALGTALGLSSVIAAFAVGLPGFSTYLYALRGFYAMKNTKIPFVINCGENVINIVTAVVFARWLDWGVVGLALSFSLAYTVSAAIAVVVLNRHSPGFDWGGLVKTWIKLLIAAGIMGGFVYGLVTFLAPGSALALIPTILAGIAVGALTYFASIFALRVPGISELMARLPGLKRFA